jgi:hypothetical protein
MDDAPLQTPMCGLARRRLSFIVLVTVISGFVPTRRASTKSAFADIGRYPRLCGVEVPHGSVRVASKNGDG